MKNEVHSYPEKYGNLNYRKKGKYYKHFLYLFILNLFIPFNLGIGQTTHTLTTRRDFNSITFYNGSGTERIIPVISTDDPLPADIEALNESIEGTSSSAEWMPLQTVAGVVKAISFTSPSTGYLAAELGVVYKTTNGGLNWTAVLNLGFPYYWYGIHAFSTERVLIAGFNNTTGDGILRWTTNGGTTWTNDIIIAPAPLNWLMGLGFADSLHGLAVGGVLSSGKVFITSNGGINVNDWTLVTADPTQGWFAGNFTMQPDGKYYITGIKFCTSTDYGLSWTNRNSIDPVFDGGVSFPDNLHGWTGGGSISPAVAGWVHRTTDGGSNWSGRILNTPYPVRVVYFFDAQTGIAQGGEGNSGLGGIWESNNGGVTFTESINTGLEMTALDWQRVSQDSVDVFSVGYSSAGGWHSVVYKKRIGYAIVPVELTSFTVTEKSGAAELSWRTAAEINNKGFEIERKSAAGVRDKIGFVPGYGTTTESRSYSFLDNTVTGGKYLYRLKQIDFDGTYEYSEEVEVDLTPIEYNLFQNYPNPFNPSTTIKYTIPLDSHVKISVYSSLGELVEILVDKMLSEGIYEINWEPENNTAGVYIYSIEAFADDGTTGYSDQKKLLYLK